MTEWTAFTYQWTRDGEAIAGATSDTYTLTAADSGKKIGLVVWGRLGGMNPNVPAPAPIWIWGEVTAGDIAAPAPGGTASPTASASAAAGSGQTGTVAVGAAATGTKGTSPSALASTGSTVLPIVGLAVVLMAVGTVVLMVRRRAQTD